MRLAEEGIAARLNAVLCLDGEMSEHGESSVEKREKQPGSPSVIRFFLLRPGSPVEERIIEVDSSGDPDEVAEAMFGSSDERGGIVLSVLRTAGGGRNGYDFFWAAGGDAPGDPVVNDYRWSVLPGGSLRVEAYEKTVIEYGPTRWLEWRPGA